MTTHELKRFITFWYRISKEDLNGCWPYQGQKIKDGYGRLRYRGRKMLAHRMAWIYSYGDIPEGMQCCHTCDNPSCCNPSHLFLGTQKDNMQDMRAKGRRIGKLRGEMVYGSKLSADQVKQIRIRHENGAKPSVLAGEYGVTSQSIRAVLKRTNWKHI